MAEVMKQKDEMQKSIVVRSRKSIAAHTAGLHPTRCPPVALALDDGRAVNRRPSSAGTSTPAVAFACNINASCSLNVTAQLVLISIVGAVKRPAEPNRG